MAHSRALRDIRDHNRDWVYGLRALLHTLRKDMRTTRVLDLCREAEQSVTDCSEHGYAIRKLSAAIREMAEGEPEPSPTPDLSIHRAKIAHAVNQALFAGAISSETTRKLYADLGYCSSILPPPKSDPPSPT